MVNPKFNIGDKVKTHSERGRGVNGVAYVSSMEEYSGVIARIEDINGTNDNGVEKWFYRLENTPFYWHESLLEAVKSENKIVITTDGTTTRAALYDGHKLIGEAKAICSKDDIFDFETGAKIAFERLTAKPTIKAKPKKELKPLNTKIFVLDGDDVLKSSHIYEIKNGKIRTFIGSYPNKGTLYNMNDVINYLKPQSLRRDDEKCDSNGVKFSVYSNLKQVTVMEVKEG